MIITEGLGKKFSSHCRIGGAEELSGGVYVEDRRQYLSTSFLDEMRPLLPEGTCKGLAVVNVDLYASGLNFVFGEAEVNGDCAVISLFRLHPQFYGFSEHESLLCQRVLKEAVHEIGHTFGLLHCRDPHCVMHFSNSIADTDKKDADFCADCLIALRAVD